jgi:hypothetical protein
LVDLSQFVPPSTDQGLSHIADRQDINVFIYSALAEIGATGHLVVHMDGHTDHANVGDATGDDMDVLVTVQPTPAPHRPALGVAFA